MNRQELLHWAVTQNQFIKGYDANIPKECYDKLYASYNRLYNKVINYCVLDAIEAPQSLKTSPVDNSEPPKKKNAPDGLEIGTFKKAGHKDSQRLKNWRKYRDSKVIELYKECKCKKQPITDEIIFRIAQIVGSTSPKVKRIINDYEFDKI